MYVQDCAGCTKAISAVKFIECSSHELTITQEDFNKEEEGLSSRDQLKGC
jgi:hypothetical protein